MISRMQLGSRLAALSLLASAAMAQPFPAKPVTIVHPFGAGSGADVNTRLMADELTRVAGVPVVVDARPGGNGVIAMQAAARAAPDGYTLFFTTNTTQVLNPILYKDLPIDALTEFVPVAGLTRGYLIMLVSAAAPYNSVADFVAQAKAGKLTFGSGSASNRMGGELFKQMAKIELLHVPYKSAPAATADLIGGRIDTAFATLAEARPLLQAGKVKVLAVSAPQRLPTLPNVPTMHESGYAGLESPFWSAIFAPRGTPDAIVKRLAELVRKANAGPGPEKNREVASMSVMDLAGTDLDRYQKEQAALWKRVAAAAGMVPE